MRRASYPAQRRRHIAADPALTGRIGVIKRVVIEKVVSGKHSPTRTVAVDSKAAFVVAERFAVSPRGKSRIADIGLGDVLQQMLSRRGPRPLRNDRVRENTQFRRGATRKIIGLTGLDTIIQFLGQ
jgi:hypothetical protein